MSDFIIRSSSNRVHFSDKKTLLSHSRKQIYFILIFVLILLILLFIWKHFFFKKETSNQQIVFVDTPQIILVPTPKPEFYSPSNIFYAKKIDSQLQIYDSNSNLVFKQYSNSQENNIEQWINDNVLLYKNNNFFGLAIFYNSIFKSDPKFTSNESCQNYSISPDKNKIIFFANKTDQLCPGTLIDFTNLSYPKITKIINNKNSSLENAFWDSDSKSLNLTLKNDLGKLETKIISF